MSKCEMLPNGNIKLTIPYMVRTHGGRVRIIKKESVADEEEVHPVLLALARGYRWQQIIDQGLYPNIKELAKAIGVDFGVVSRAVRLTMLSPKIVHLIVTGDLEVTITELKKSIPVLWEEQEAMFIK